MRTSGAAATILAVALTLTAAPLASAATQRVTLTNTDNGRSVTVAAGDDIAVRLTATKTQGQKRTWAVPTSADPVMHRTSGGTAPNGDVSAVFHAERSGTTTLSSASSCRPDPGHACPELSIPWRVSVTVK
jgi:hypothetical protein